MSIRLYNVPPLNTAIAANGPPAETILLPIAGTTGAMGAPGGVAYRVDQTIRNIGTSRISVSTSACGTATSPCELHLDAGQSAHLAALPGQRPFILVMIPRGAAKQFAFSTVVHAGNWPAVEIPAISESAFQQDCMVIPAVPTNASLFLRAWQFPAAPGTPIVVRAAQHGKVIAEKTFAADDAGYLAKSDLQREFPQLAGRPADIIIESAGVKVWGMITTTDYKTGKIVLSVPRLNSPPPLPAPATTPPSRPRSR
jgi:hypothetical protein